MKLTLLAPPERREQVELPAGSTLQQLKERCGSWLGVATSRLRVISAGRVLSGDASSLETLRVQPDSTVHVVVSSVGRSSSPGSSAPSSSSSTSVRRPPASAPAAPASATPAAATLRGFDRLRLLGLDDTEIDIIRATYMADVEREAGPRVQQAAGESTRDHLLRMEDEWVRRQAETSEFALNIGPLLIAASRRAAAAGALGRGARPGDREGIALLDSSSDTSSSEDDSGEEGEDDEGAAQRRRQRRERQLRELVGGTRGEGNTDGAAGGAGASPSAPRRPTLVTYSDRSGNRFVALMDSSGRIGAAAPVDRSGASSWGGDVESGDGEGDASPAQREARQSSGIDWTSFAFGLCIGVTVGFIMLLWLPQNGFSRSFRAGVILGIVINITGSVWSPASSATTGTHAGAGSKSAQAAAAAGLGDGTDGAADGAGGGAAAAAAGAQGEVGVRSNELLTGLSGRFVPLIG